MKTPSPLLHVSNLRVDVGERNVLKSVSLDVAPGVVVATMVLAVVLQGQRS